MMALALTLLTGCAIENDIPYPEVNGLITGIAVEGQRAAEGETNAAATIDNTARTVTLYVNDSVDVSRLRITQLALNPTDVELTLDSALCDDAERFPFGHFASLDSVPASANTRVDFSSPVTFTLRKYADYPWKVTVNQIIQRDIDVEGMTRHVLDQDSRTVIIYMNPETFDAENVNIKTFNLGGEYGEVSPDPTTVHDFTTSRTFLTRLNWEPEGQFREWRVFAYPDPESGSEATGDVFAMVSRATVSGNCTSGSTVSVEYKPQSATDWQTASDVTVSGTSYTATLTGLRASTAYSYRAVINGSAGAESTFTTAAEVALENGGFESWYQDGDIYVPNASGSSFWGTGNPGAASFIGNLTTPTTDAVSGQAAKLESKNALIKLGAGNIFTGDFSLDGTNGILHFGQPFTTFPTALRLYYKYTSTTINRIGDEVGSLENLRGRPDSCHIYVALSDKSEPYEIRTRPSVRKVFDKNDANIIAYGEFISGSSTSSYQQITIPLEYRANRTPRYIVIVCSASKYGDYFIGGEGSTLWLDEMELVYE